MTGDPEGFELGDEETGDVDGDKLGALVVGDRLGALVVGLRVGLGGVGETVGSVVVEGEWVGCDTLGDEVGLELMGC